MNKKRIIQITLSVFAILATVPGAMLAAKKLEAYELVWLIPVFPAFTIAFFWIVIIMVNHFISADSYQSPKAIQHAQQFLKFFEALYMTVLVLFLIAARVVYLHFRP